MTGKIDINLYNQAILRINELEKKLDEKAENIGVKLLGK